MKPVLFVGLAGLAFYFYYQYTNKDYIDPLSNLPKQIPLQNTPAPDGYYWTLDWNSKPVLLKKGNFT